MCVRPCHQSILSSSGSRASFCQKQGAKEPAGAKGAGAKAGEKASAKTSGDEVWSKETDYL